MNVFLADWTVGPGHFLHTFMGILEVVGQTHVALVAVEILAPTSNPANSAAVTVELLFVLVIIELTLVTEILAEDCATLRTGLLHLLPEAAVAALDLLDVVPPEGVVLLLVVTEPAAVEAVAARRHKLALSFVMLAPILGIIGLIGLIGLGDFFN